MPTLRDGVLQNTIYSKTNENVRRVGAVSFYCNQAYDFEFGSDFSEFTSVFQKKIFNLQTFTSNFPAEKGRQILTLIENCHNDGTSGELKLQYQTADLETKYYNFIVTPTPMNETKCTCTMVDISEMYIHNLDAYFHRYLLDNIKDSLIAVDENGIVSYWNDGAARIFNIDKSEILGKSIDLLGSGFNIEDFRQMVANGIPFKQSDWNYKKDDQDTWVEVTTTAILGQNNTVIGVLGIAKEITELKKTQLEVSFHQNLLETLFDKNRTGILIIDENHNVIYCNSKASKRLNQWCDKNIVKGRKVDFNETGPESLYFTGFSSALQSENSNQETEYFENGQINWFKISFFSLNDIGSHRPKLAACIIENVTDLKQNEIALSDTAIRLDSFFKHAYTGMFIFNLDGELLKANPAFEKILGYNLEKQIDLNYAKISVPQDYSTEYLLLEDLKSGNLSSYEISKQFLNSEGLPTQCITEISLVRNYKDEPDYIIGIIQDVSHERELIQELWNTKNRLKLANEAAEIGIWEYDLNSEVLTWDKCMKNLYGLDDSIDDELSFETWSLYIYPDDLQETILGTTNVINGAPRMEVNFRIFKDDEIRHIQAYAVKFEQDGASKLIGLNWDITDAVKSKERILRLNSELQESEEYMRSLLERGHDAVVVLDTDFIIKDATVSTANVIGYENTECIGRVAWRLMNFPDQGKFLKDWYSMLNAPGSSFDIDIPFVHKDGREIWLETTFTNLLKHETVNGVVMNFRDATTRFKSVEQLQKAKEAAEEISKLKGSFLANMSHEIRTPLNGIMGLATLIGDETNLNSIREYASLQIQSSSRLLETVNSILEMAKLEAKSTSLNQTNHNLCELVKIGVKSFKLLAEEKGLDFRFSCDSEDLIVEIDPGVIHQVVNNVVGNAVKFTLKGFVDVHAFENLEDDQLYFNIRVQDSGIGIDPTFISKLFDAFEQESQGYSRRFEGSGLGLSITKKYIEILGGSIEVNSTKDVGSTFHIRIPVKRIDS
ncbi:MAG: PAS domain S-box protein [Cryomorphaceae bacterium]|nr:PAS domain S-box protein [Cryomorphaceae bacterium]